MRVDWRGRRAGTAGLLPATGELRTRQHSATSSPPPRLPPHSVREWVAIQGDSFKARRKYRQLPTRLFGDGGGAARDRLAAVPPEGRLEQHQIVGLVDRV